MNRSWSLLALLLLVASNGLCLRAEVTLTTLYSFTGASDGANPAAKLLKGSDGNFYGTTTYGGIGPGFFGNGNGTVFRISPDGTFTTLYSFTGGDDGANPAFDLTEGNDGNLYGTTQFGGSENFGTVFCITPSGTLTTLAALPSNQSGSMSYIASVIEGADGNFYGTFQYFGTIGVDYGGPGDGVVYEMSPDGTFSNLFSFDGTNGAYPQPGLVAGGDGSFYGTTSTGGTNDLGIVFRITTNGTFTCLHSFTGGADGADPGPGLVVGKGGELYGTTVSGGAANVGTVFKITTNGVLTTVYSFRNVHGSYPYPPVVEGPDGTIYGENGNELYQISTNGVFTVLLYFNGLDGSDAEGGLVLGDDGKLYGITSGGGTYNAGSVFSLSASLEPVFKSISLTDNDTVALVWSSIVGQSYQLQYKNSLSDSNWLDLGNTLDAGFDLITNYDSIAPGNSQRFYRVMLMQ